MKFSLILASFALFSISVQAGGYGKHPKGSRTDSSTQNRKRKNQDSHEIKKHQESKDNEYWEKNKYCAVWKGFRCTKCALKTYWNGKTCVPSNPNCKTFDKKDGCCTSCFGGYKLDNGKCVIAQPQAIDPLCHQFEQGKCVECSKRAYFGRHGECVNVNPLCKTFDRHDGCCTSCYPGYILQNGGCVVDPHYKGKKRNSKEQSRQKRRSSSNERSKKSVKDNDDKPKPSNDGGYLPKTVVVTPVIVTPPVHNDSNDVKRKKNLGRKQSCSSSQRRRRRSNFKERSRSESRWGNDNGWGWGNTQWGNDSKFAQRSKH